MPGENPYQKAALRAGEVFTLLMQTYDFCLQRTLRKYGLYPGQPEILFILARAAKEGGEKPTQNEIAKALGVSRASAGVSLRRMEKAGFVKRAADHYDTRCNRIALTQRGKEFAHWCELDVEMIFTTLLEDFEGEDRAKAIHTLERMQKSLAGMRERIEG